MSDVTQPSRIRRGPQPRARATVTRRGTGRAQPPRGGSPSRALVRMPAAPKRLVQLAKLVVAFAVLCGVVVLLTLIGVPQYLGRAAGEAVGDAGFVMKRVEPRGLHHLDPMVVYNAAYDQQSTAMPLVDLDAIRARLLAYGWVKDARVSRRLPDTLVVDVVERTPAAVWQQNGQLRLVDADGVVLDDVPLDKLPDLPFVIGPDANRQIAQLQVLLAAAPALKPLVADATWIGGRRWDIHFHSGETLSLPEGVEAARHALVKFQGIDSDRHLLGQGFKRIDMRLPGQLTIRLSGEPGHEIGDTPAAAMAAPAPAPQPTSAPQAAPGTTT